MKHVIIIPLLLAMIACSDSGSDGTATVSLSLQPVLSGGALAGSSFTSRSVGQPRVADSCDAVENYPDYQAQWGASGAPDSMNLYLKSIALSTSESSKTATLFQSSDPDGDTIVIDNSNGGSINLADLAAAIEAEPDEDGNVIEAEVNTGVFNQLTITFRNEADITGCLTEDWSATPVGTGNNQCDNDNDACNSLEEDTYTVCTGAATSSASGNALSIFDLVEQSGAAKASSVTDDAQFSDYVDNTLNPSGTETKVNLNIRDVSDNFNPTADATFRLDIPTVTLENGGNVNLTLAFDMNLLLRFEGNTRYERDGSGDFHPLGNVMQSLNDSKELDAAYFHTSYLPDVMGLYLGEPGTVEGYEVKSCYEFVNELADPNADPDLRAVESWMTMIYDPDGDLITGFTTPKDDAGFVIVKGSINKLDDGTRPSIKNSDDSYDLKFGQQSFEGAINNWTSLDSVDEDNLLAKENIEQSVRNESDVADRTEPTWYYKRKL